MTREKKSRAKEVGHIRLSLGILVALNGVQGGLFKKCKDQG